MTPSYETLRYLHGSEVPESNALDATKTEFLHQVFSKMIEEKWSVQELDAFNLGLRGLFGRINVARAKMISEATKQLEKLSPAEVLDLILQEKQNG